MVVLNGWVTQGRQAAGFIDAAGFESIKKQGDPAIRNWIDEPLEGTSVTVALVGERFAAVDGSSTKSRRASKTGRASWASTSARSRTWMGTPPRDAVGYLAGYDF